MANTQLLLPPLFFACLLATLVLNCHCDDKKVHIVYMGSLPHGEESTKLTHHSMLKHVLGSASSAKDSLVYSYGKSFNGFAAKLSDDEVAKISRMKGVVSVFPNRILKLHTTHSWDFLGFSQGTGNSGEGRSIVGVLDTGAWPESDSFSDKDLGPPPATWKGSCNGGANFTCNNKIIGARYYNSEGYGPTDIASARDGEGHGTHTASTAAGREVAGASFEGLAQGVARGGAPCARIAVYKVCWSYGCPSADILAAFNDAIKDKVDILSLSLGSEIPLDYLQDPIAIGAFHAIKHGILTSNSAGNSGPYPASVTNSAPWTLTVAASTIDRKFVTKVILGDGFVINGVSVNSFELYGKSYPLIWAGDAANYTYGSNPEIASLCQSRDSLNSYKVEGTIVLCDTVVDGSAIREANGVGAIMTGSDQNRGVAFSFPLSVSVISGEDAARVKNYIRTTDFPVATILKSETFKDDMAPTVAYFSSRGPNSISPDIHKPDMTAPGVDILAAWSPLSSPSVDPNDPRRVSYNIISGTSMSCPHVSGAAAYVKAAHPDWSPAAVKSALMTTATVVDPEKHPDREFAYGSGQINPSRATDPGLIFDASEPDYVNFLCKQGYDTTTLQLVTGDNSTCTGIEPGRGWDLNYPSFSLYVEDGQEIFGIFPRTVTNVGDATSTYTATVYTPGIDGVTAEVQPSVLSFSTLGEKKTFTVKVTGPTISQQPIMSGAITWRDGTHEVRTPLVIYTWSLQSTTTAYSMSRNKTSFKGLSMYHKNGIMKRY